MTMRRYEANLDDDVSDVIETSPAGDTQPLKDLGVMYNDTNIANKQAVLDHLDIIMSHIEETERMSAPGTSIAFWGMKEGGSIDSVIFITGSIGYSASALDAFDFAIELKPPNYTNIGVNDDDNVLVTLKVLKQYIYESDVPRA